ncbi:hypothetical protein WDU94_003371 [Cyamophila willieti]
MHQNKSKPAHVFRLNPFRRQSEVVPPQNVTRSVQTDINGPFPSGHSRSQITLQDSNDNNVSRKGINKLLQAFQRENLNVATLMDQEGRIFFTIDLTEVIFKDVELENIVKVVQKTMREPSHGSLTNNSDEISKKLKRHFLFESMKRLSESYHSNTPDKNNGILAHSMANGIRSEFDKLACEYNKSSISAHETELKSLLYEVKSSMSAEKNDDLLEDLKSSLATKIFKKIEQTIDSIKRKHNYNQEIGSNANISIVFSRHCNPIEQKQRKVSSKKPNPDNRPPTKQHVLNTEMQSRKERIENKKMEKSKLERRSDSSVEKTSEDSGMHRKRCDAEKKRKDAVEKARRFIVPSSERQITPPTGDNSKNENSVHSFENTKHKTEHVKINESGSAENRKDKYQHRKMNNKNKEHKKKCTKGEIARKYITKTPVKRSSDRINRESVDKARPEIKHKPKGKSKRDEHRQDREKTKGKPKKRDETKKARPTTQHQTRLRKCKEKTMRDDKHRKRKEDDGPIKLEAKGEEAEQFKNIVESEHVVVLFNSNKRGDDKSNRRTSRSVKKEVKEARPIKERCAFTSSDNSQVHRGIMEANPMANLKPRDIPAGSSEKLIAVISFGPP